MKSIFIIFQVLFIGLNICWAENICLTNLDGMAAQPIEDLYVAYGLGIITQLDVNFNEPANGYATIRMLKNIGQEKSLKQFKVAITPLTSAAIFPNPNALTSKAHPYLPFAQWPIIAEKPYFFSIIQTTNQYLLTAIDSTSRWEKEEEMKAYLASGQLQKDKERADILDEEIRSSRKEMTQLLTELKPLNLSEEEFRARIAPLEKRDKELRSELEEVWSHFKYIPHNTELFGGTENASSVE